MVSYPVVQSLAPSSFRSYRQSRSRGDEGSVCLADFAEADQAMIVDLYAALGELAEVFRGEREVAGARIAYRDRIGALLGVGRPQLAGPTREDIAAALHDIRGGTMTALLLGLGETSAAGRTTSADVALLALLRDQRKIIRNIVKDVDPAGLERDRAAIPHSLAELGGGIASYGRLGHGAAAIEIHRDADAVVAASCLEFAALERAVFNLLNNASRHVDEGVVDVWLDALDSDARIVVANPVPAAHGDTLTTTLAADPAALYGAFSTTGSGLGLSIVASIVGNAYGLTEAEELVGDGYIGTRVVDGTFLTWLHWPLAR